GDTTPLSALNGVYPQETIFLEVKGGDPRYAPEWFSSNVVYGNFLQPGELLLRNAGTFEIHVFVGPLSKTLSVTVAAGTASSPTSPSAPTTTPTSPTAPSGNPMTPSTSIPPSVPSDSFMDEVVSFQPGSYAGFGSDHFPEVVLGPPQGGGLYYG